MVRGWVIIQKKENFQKSVFDSCLTYYDLPKKSFFLVLKLKNIKNGAGIGVKRPPFT